MASITTDTFGNSSCPRLRLDYSTSQSNTDVTVSWTLYYVTTTYGGAAHTNGNARAWSVTIDGETTYGSYNINGVTNTSGVQIGSGSKTISRPASINDNSAAIKIVFDIDITWSSTYASSVSGSTSITIPHKSYYTVSYNANGGSGAPSSQTKWYGETLTLSTTQPTRTGYKFKGWGTSASATTTQTTYTGNSAATFYAVWEEYALTVNYYSNYATSSFSGATNAVGANKNVIVRTATFYYDNAYTDGLHNYTSTSAGTYLGRTGYTGTGNWGTSTSGGTLVNQDTEFATGQKLAEAFGKSLKNGNASVNVYAQWRENKLTVTYYSNYADYFKSGSSYTPLNTVGADKNVAVYKYEFKYATAYNSTSTSEGLFNYSNEAGALYMTRTRYDATGYWCTTTAEDVKLEGNKNETLTYDGGIAIGENKTFASGQALAEALGLTLANGDKSINLYANWVLLASRITVYQSDGTPIKGLLHIYDEDMNVHYGIMTIYDSDGNAREVI